MLMLLKGLNLNKINYTDQFLGSQENVPKVDCISNNVYSFSNDDCEKQCLGSNFISLKGICLTENKNISKKCDSEKGLLEFIEGDAKFGKIKKICLSIDPGIQANDENQKNLICEDGKIDINYNISFPNVKNCVCEEGKIPILIDNTSSIRKHAVCMNKELSPIFNHDKLLL